MFTSVHNLLNKRLMLSNTVSVVTQVVNMGINIKLNLLIAESAVFIKASKLCDEKKSMDRTP